MRVLIVENQPVTLKVLKHSLHADGFQVDTCQDGDEAAYKVHATGYDLIVLSMLLPGDQGFTLLRSWRRGGVTAAILALAAAGSLGERVQCLDLGADDYVARPFSLPELMARVRALLRRTHRVADPILRIHDLEIDTNSHSVRRAGRPVRLTRREYALLQFLAFHRGKVVTRAMIWEHLYNEEDESTSNVVDVYIRYLRNKIDRGFDPALILTRWGMGYELRGDEGPE